ncbi:MAG: PQQ-binding-like beta-propeller repeat protein, partial [Kiritimatiellae bacterium]|nr:PQQ-binding-like beta-propeller repeat protein [Kiritimatiellia bacterium]
KWWDSVPKPENIKHDGNVTDVYLNSFKETKAKHPNCNEDHLRIRIITDILDPDKDGDPHSSTVMHIANIASDIYLKHKDYANSAFWSKRIFDLIPSKNKKYVYPLLTKRCNKNPELRPYIISFYKEYVFDSQIARKEKATISILLLEMINHDNADTKVLTFIKEHQDILTQLVPKRILIYEIKSEISKGDKKQAQLLLKELEKDLSDAEKKRLQFHDLKKSVNGIKQSTIQCPVDWEFDSIVRNAKNLTGESKSKLHQLIRSTLSDKYEQVMQSSEDGLFTGAYFGYQEAFASYAPAYNASLNPYLHLLKNTLNYTDKQIEQKKEMLWLGKNRKKYTTPQRQLTTSTLKLPSSGNMTYQPLLSLNKGTLEIVNETSSLDAILTKVQPAGIAVNQSLVFLQNSREIACMRDNKLLWRKIFDNSAFKKKRSIYYKYLSGSTKPLTDTKCVYARLMQKGEFSLYAFYQQTGKVAWQLSDRDYIICSDPILWNNHILVVAKKKGILSKFSFLMVNPRNGEILTKLNLMQSYNYIISATTFYTKTHLAVDYYMPTPTIIDDTAYIITNLGIVSSIDLTKRAINWQRKYIRTPFNVSVKSRKALSRRNQYAPVVNKKYVLFPTIDGITLQVIDRISGKIITETSDSLWTEIHQIGSNALFFEESGKVDIRNLQNFNTIATLPKAEYKYIANLQDGAILKCADKLQVWNDKGTMVKEVSIPDHFIPSLLTGEKIFGYNKNDIQAIVGFIGKGANASSPPVAVSSEKYISHLQKGNPVSKQNEIYIIADNYLVKLANDLSYKWAVARHSFQAGKAHSIFVSDKYIYMIKKTSIDILDRGTGRQVGRFPEYGEPLKLLTGSVLSNNKLYFANNVNKLSYEVFVMENIKPRIIGIMNDSSSLLCIMKNGTSVASARHNTLSFKTLDPVEKIYKMKKNYTAAELDITHMGIIFKPINDGLFISDRAGNGACIHLIRDDMSFEQIRIPHLNGATRRVPQYKNYFLSGDMLVVPVPKTEMWHLVDTTKKSGLSTNIDIQTKPIFIKNSLYGGKNEKESLLYSRTFDTRTGKKTFEKKLTLQDIDKNWGYLSKQRFSFNFNSHPSYVSQMSAGMKPSPEMVWIIHNPATGKVEVKGLPDTGDIYSSYAKNSNLILCRENDVLRFKYREL